jgi:hypothetical protein
MLLLGVPTLLLGWYVSLRLSVWASLAFISFSMLPYSYFYTVAYRLCGIAEKPDGRWKFYLAVFAVQVVVIAGLVALRSSEAAA